MNLRLIREPTDQETTLGVLMVRGRFFGFTLEDSIREVAGQPVESWKVAGSTAIPAGRYRVSLTWSNRFNRVQPQVMDVPGFEGVRIHSGNRHEDTEGCILVGMQRAGIRIQESRMAMAGLQSMLEASRDGAFVDWLEIENPRD